MNELPDSFSWLPISLINHYPAEQFWMMAGWNALVP